MRVLGHASAPVCTYPDSGHAAFRYVVSRHHPTFGKELTSHAVHVHSPLGVRNRLPPPGTASLIKKHSDPKKKWGQSGFAPLDVNTSSLRPPEVLSMTQIRDDRYFARLVVHPMPPVSPPPACKRPRVIGASRPPHCMKLSSNRVVECEVALFPAPRSFTTTKFFLPTCSRASRMVLPASR